MTSSSFRDSSLILSGSLTVVTDLFCLGPKTSKQSTAINGWRRFLVSDRDIAPGEVISEELTPFIICAQYNDDDISLGLIIKATSEQLLDKALEDLVIWEGLRVNPLYAAARDQRMTHETSICISNAVSLSTGVSENRYLDSMIINRPNGGDENQRSKGGKMVKKHAGADEILHASGVYLTLGMMPHSCSPNTSHIISVDGSLMTRASRRINRGDVITRSWMHQQYVSFADRQREFAQQFGVGTTCQCETCFRCTVTEGSNVRDKILHQCIDNFYRYSVAKDCERLAQLDEHDPVLQGEWKSDEGDNNSAYEAHRAAGRVHKDMKSERRPSGRQAPDHHGHRGSNQSLAVVSRLIALMELYYQHSFCNVQVLVKLHLHATAIHTVRLWEFPIIHYPPLQITP